MREVKASQEILRAKAIALAQRRLGDIVGPINAWVAVENEPHRDDPVPRTPWRSCEVNQIAQGHAPHVGNWSPDLHGNPRYGLSPAPAVPCHAFAFIREIKAFTERIQFLDFMRPTQSVFQCDGVLRGQGVVRHEKQKHQRDAEQPLSEAAFDVIWHADSRVSDNAATFSDRISALKCGGGPVLSLAAKSMGSAGRGSRDAAYRL
jgi:hypothetical protein